MPSTPLAPLSPWLVRLQEACAMQLLPAGQFARVVPLVAGLPFNTLFAQSVLSGDFPGLVWVDHLAEPQACYVLHGHGMALLAGGSEDEAFRQALVAHLLNAHGGRGHFEWLQVQAEPWEAFLAEALGDRLVLAGGAAPREASVEGHTRLNFRFDPRAFAAAKAELGPSTLPLHRMSAADFEAIQGSVVASDFWRDAQHFEADGVGFVLKDGEAWAATAFSAFKGPGQLELGVETHPAYRGQGHASHACAAFVQHALDEGLEPVWACGDRNLGSQRLAQKLGFQPSLRLPYYRLVEGPRA